jgi:hypothetical protein
MTGHGRLLSRGWLLAAGAVLLIIGHGAILYSVSSHLAALSAAVVPAVVTLVVMSHLGLFGPVYGFAPPSASGSSRARRWR